MFVLELRGYMQNADAAGELDPVGRISVHEDRDNDGVYETHKVFVDHLIFPRFVLPFGANAILAKESNSDDVWKFTDTNGDGTSDKKELFTSGLGRLLNVEHQESGFTWGLDNWIYSTINSARVRWTPGGVLRELCRMSAESALSTTFQIQGDESAAVGARWAPSSWRTKAMTSLRSRDRPSRVRGVECLAEATRSSSARRLEPLGVVTENVVGVSVLDSAEHYRGGARTVQAGEQLDGLAHGRPLLSPVAGVFEPVDHVDKSVRRLGRVTVAGDERCGRRSRRHRQ